MVSFFDVTNRLFTWYAIFRADLAVHTYISSVPLETLKAMYFMSGRIQQLVWPKKNRIFLLPRLKSSVLAKKKGLKIVETFCRKRSKKKLTKIWMKNVENNLQKKLNVKKFPKRCCKKYWKMMNNYFQKMKYCLILMNVGRRKKSTFAS